MSVWQVSLVASGSHRLRFPLDRLPTYVYDDLLFDCEYTLPGGQKGNCRLTENVIINPQ